MPRRLLSALALVAIALPAWTGAGACGDKLLLIGRGLRYRAISNSHPASILAYFRPDSPTLVAMTDPKVQPALRDAGHSLKLVQTAEQFNEALKSGKYDIVFVDAQDAEFAQRQVETTPSNPVLLPVVYQGTKAQVREVEKRYGSALSVPARPSTYVSAVEKALAGKDKQNRGAGAGGSH